MTSSFSYSVERVYKLFGTERESEGIDIAIISMYKG